jgi:hypothetical protein
MRVRILLSVSLVLAFGAAGPVCDWLCGLAGDPAEAASLAPMAHTAPLDPPGMGNAPCHASAGGSPEPSGPRHDGDECPGCDAAMPLLTANAFGPAAGAHLAFAALAAPVPAQIAPRARRRVSRAPPEFLPPRSLFLQKSSLLL